MSLLAYFITFHTYGTWLHGDDRGSVDDEHNLCGHPFVPPDARRLQGEYTTLKTEPVVLTPQARELVDSTIREVCNHREWLLHAINVRSNHVHLVVSAGADVSKVLHDVKAWPTRRLVEHKFFSRGSPVWTRHGSTRYLNTQASFEAAIDYVKNHQ